MNQLYIKVNNNKQENIQSTMTVRQRKNDDYGGEFSEYGLTYKILNNFGALENQNQQRENYLEFCQTSHIPRKD